MVCFIIFINDNTRKAVTVCEWIIADGGDGAGDRDARKVGATLERIIADGGDGVRNRYTCKVGTTLERPNADSCDSIPSPIVLEYSGNDKFLVCFVLIAD